MTSWIAVDARADDPKVVPSLTSQFKISTAGVGAGRITQFAFGPDDRIYASTYDQGVQSFHYDATTGSLSDRQQVSDIQGLGIAFQQSTGQMYVSSLDGSIYRLSRDSTGGTWGQSDGLRVPIVQNLPVGDHTVDNIQIVGNSLYVGIGDRTINGGTGVRTGGAIDDYGGSGMFNGGQGRTFGESAYNGTISTIRDLTQVANTPNAAGLFNDTSQNTIQHNSTPFTSTDAGKLTVVAAGTRNPYGMAVDKTGSVFFTNNFNRANTLGDGTADYGRYGDAPGPDLNKQVHDQFFKLVEGGDYGFHNDNWRGNTPILTSNAQGSNRQNSITFDNLYSSDPRFEQPYDPENPVGLGPSASADGVAFSYSDNLAPGLYGDAFIARYNPTINNQGGTQTFHYADLVAVDPITGEIRVIADGFSSPLAVIADANGNLLVSDFGTSSVYFLRALAVPEPSSIILALASLALMGRMGLTARRS